MLLPAIKAACVVPNTNQTSRQDATQLHMLTSCTGDWNVSSSDGVLCCIQRIFSGDKTTFFCMQHSRSSQGAVHIRARR